MVKTSDIIPTCSLLTRLTHNPKLPEVLQHNLISRIESLVDLVPYTDVTLAPTTVYILPGKEAALSIDNQVIKISLSNLDAPGVLERALLFSRLNNGRPIAAAATADFLWREFIARTSISTHRSWRTYLSSIVSYCQSESKLLVHFDFCETQNEFIDSFIASDTPQVIPWALSNFYSQYLSDLYKSLNLSEKAKLLNNLVFLDEPDDLFIEKIGNSKSSLKNQELAFEQLITSWILPVDIEKTIVQKNLARYLLRNQDAYNYIVVGRSSRDIFPLEFTVEDDDVLSEPMIIQYGGTRYFYPSDVPNKTARMDIFNATNIKNVIYVSCDLPEVESLLEFKPFTQKVTFVRQCESDDVDWNHVAAIGLNDFLKENSNTEFVEYNLSALALAQKMRGPLQNSDDFLAWQKWLNWEKSVPSEDPSVLRPLAAIDGVERYRLF